MSLQLTINNIQKALLHLTLTKLHKFIIHTMNFANKIIKKKKKQSQQLLYGIDMARESQKT